MTVGLELLGRHPVPALHAWPLTTSRIGHHSKSISHLHGWPSGPTPGAGGQPPTNTGGSQDGGESRSFDKGLERNLTRCSPARLGRGRSLDAHIAYKNETKNQVREETLSTCPLISKDRHLGLSKVADTCRWVDSTGYAKLAVVVSAQVPIISLQMATR